jgi:alpha-tubulin suppressor-like RCC1 family protein
VSYTAGSTAGYNIRVNRTGDYVRLVSASGGPYLQMGGAIGSSAELFKMAVSGAGYTFQAVSNGLFVRAMGTVNAGSDLVADTSTGDVFTMQNCNGSGDPTHYNRWGFKSPGSGTKPYWQSASSVVQIEANNNGNAGVCATTSATAWEAFYLDPGQDVLTITDTAQHSSTVTVTVQPPITFTSPTFAVAGSTPVSNQALGGNGTFTGGSAGCTVTTNATGGGSCTTTAWGTVGYTPGNTSGTDTITLTDSVGHTGYFTVSVGVSLSQLSAGPNYFSCAKVSDGTARCWGSNGMSELGQGFTSTYSATPVTVRGLSGVSSVVTGENHACALLSNNTIKCWGDNQFGQLGNGTTTTSWTPVTVSGISDATAVSAGMHHTCALRSGGTVVCWGYNASYQIGNSSATYWPRATSPATVTGLSSVTAIAAGGFHNCALTGGAVKCWGDNSFGQLGNGSSTNSFSPVSVTSLTSGVSGIAGGEQHACAVKSGYVKCWGDNTYGQLGDGTKTNRSTPVSVQSLVNVAEVAAGYPFTCARITDKSVKCWGRNAEGELGDTTTTERLIPTTVAAINTVNSISAGGLNACAALSSGLGTCWGYNGYGQIGNNSTTNVTTPTGVTFGCQTCNQPDVIVSNTTWSPASVSAGGNVTFSATVFNAGTGITPVGTIVGLRWDIDGGQTNWSDSFTTGLAPGASVTLAANGGGAGSIWTTTSGSHTLQAWVDDVNRFGESDETNNKFSRTMTLGVDLVVSSLTWSPSTPSSGTQTTFSCVVTNIGTTATPGGTILGVRFDIDGSIVNWEDAYTTSLAAGASVTLTATGGPSGWSYWPATSGTHTLQGWVDDVNRFGEVNRGNNTTTTTFIVP